MITRRMLTVLAAAFTFGDAGGPTRAAAKGGSKVVYHLIALDKVSFVLGSIPNHYAGTAGEGSADITLVVHGPALQAFRKDRADIALADGLATLVENGLAPRACINTLKTAGIGVASLLPGFVVAERGGVVLLAELQARGYSYIRP